MNVKILELDLTFSERKSISGLVENCSFTESTITGLSHMHLFYIISGWFRSKGALAVNCGVCVKLGPDLVMDENKL